jgi:hypothetical protein
MRGVNSFRKYRSFRRTSSQTEHFIGLNCHLKGEISRLGLLLGLNQYACTLNHNKFKTRMKHIVKSVIIIFLFSFLVETASAQVAFGLKGGLNLTNINADDAQATYNSRTGYHAGLFLREKFGKVAIQPEALLFTQSNTIDNYQGLYHVKQSLTYLSIPVMVKFYPVLGLNLQVGPQFGFLLDGDRTTDMGFVQKKENIKDYYKSSDVSISAGFGYDFDFGLNLDFRYNIGVQDINNASGGEKAKSQIFLVSLGWNFLDN